MLFSRHARLIPTTETKVVTLVPYSSVQRHEEMQADSHPYPLLGMCRHHQENPFLEVSNSFIPNNKDAIKVPYSSCPALRGTAGTINRDQCHQLMVPANLQQTNAFPHAQPGMGTTLYAFPLAYFSCEPANSPSCSCLSHA